MKFANRYNGKGLYIVMNQKYPSLSYGLEILILLVLVRVQVG